MIIGLHLRKRIDAIIRTAQDVSRFLLSKKVKVIVSPEISDIFPALELYSKEKSTKVDLMISIGGDGTFLETAQTALFYNIPIVGINFGHTGFLTNIEEEEIFSSISDILKNKYRIEERSILSGTIIRNGIEMDTMLAVNDFVVQRDPFDKILIVDVFLDKMKISSMRSDGIIISTSTGSTAYSLSAGGPIVDPLCDNIIINPLCPHKLSNRCVIVPGNKTLYLTISTKSEKTCLIFDGRHQSHLMDMDHIRIESPLQKLKMVFLKEKNFYQILNEKFQWGL